MKMYRTRLLALGIIAGTAGMVATATALAPQFDLDWFTIDGGGAMFSTDREFDLSGTIGQYDAGQVMTARGFELTGGFWFSLAPGDCNWDGGINLFDHGGFQDCMVGPDAEPDPSCPCFDLDGDKDVDLADFARLQRDFSGS